MKEWWVFFEYADIYEEKIGSVSALLEIGALVPPHWDAVQQYCNSLPVKECIA